MGGDDTSTPAASKKAITAFSLNGVEGTINKTENTIVVTMPSGTSVTALVATFTTTGASVKVDSTVQESGTTANDFTSPVFYTVTADDATTHVYTVTVIVAGKSITAFSLNGVVGTINETKKTIVVNMPSGTNVTALVATFTTTGASVEVGSTVQESGTTANNFTSPVVYTVTAVDATTQDYTVTVTIGDVNQPATTISVSMSPNNPSTASSSITGSYTVTDVDGGSVIETEWYDNGVLRQTHATTLASGTDTLSGGFSLSHTITWVCDKFMSRFSRRRPMLPKTFPTVAQDTAA